MQTFKIVRSGRVCEPATRYSSPDSIFDVMNKEMHGLDREHFIVIHLDNKKQLIAKEVVSIGSLTCSIVHPREVFKAAIINNSQSLILIHNHPSGDPAPSYEDIDITRRLKEVGQLVGIEVIDHIIFGDRCFYSFATKGISSKKKNKKIY